MKLFRRLLLSLFPQNLLDQQMNPASMFVSFISPKQFFSVVNRRMVENYKLNLFDVGLDPFEVKIGFGDQPMVNVKDIDFYYAYNATANLNGWTFYTPATLGTAVSLVVAGFTSKIFKGTHYSYFAAFLTAVHLLTFVFAARIKVFPYTDREKNYAWFVDLFFAFYKVILEQQGRQIDDRKLAKLKTSLLQQIQIFFMLFYFYQRINKLFASPNISDKEFYQRLFYEELKGKQKTIVSNFVTNAQTYAKIKAFSDVDKEVIKLVAPADMLIRHLLQGEDTFVIVDKLVSRIYDRETIEAYMVSFLKWDEQFEEFIHTITDRRFFKEHYFQGIQKLTTHKFRLTNNYETTQEIDSFISSIEETGWLKGMKVPDKLKQESMMMDRLVHFYVTFLGGMRVARGDNFYLRLFRKDLVDAIITDQEMPTLKQDALFFYGGLLYNYSKNIFYYKYAFDNVRAGHNTFHLPFKAGFKEVYSNMFILKLFDENFVNTILQDINKKTIKIFVTNKEILRMFKNMLGSRVSSMMKAEKNELINELYGKVSFFLQSIVHFLPTLKKEFKDQDIMNLRDNLYTLDLWLWIEGLQLLADNDTDLSSTYGDLSIIGISAGMRDTLFGFLLRYTYVQKEARDAKVDLHLQVLKKIYIVDVLNIADIYYTAFENVIEQLVIRYHPMLTHWIEMDDNQKYFSIAVGNRISATDGKKDEQILAEVAGEDVIWFRGYLKTISYYNKRYVIPK